LIKPTTKIKEKNIKKFLFLIKFAISNKFLLSRLRAAYFLKRFINKLNTQAIAIIAITV
jgi:hypothetical protein